MKKPILLFSLLISFCFHLSAQTACEVETQTIACVNERIIITFDTDEIYDDIRIDAYTVAGGTQQAAIIENITDNSAEVIFTQGGDAEVIVRFLIGNDLKSKCNQNVFVLGDEPISALGALGNFVENQLTCSILDLDFDMFITCPDCPFTWTLNGEEIEIEQLVVIEDPLQIIEGNLRIEELGSYTFCQQIYKQDSTCFVEDCIEIEIIDLDIFPSFELNDDETIFCNGTSLGFTNTTVIDENVIYVWEIAYDTLEWRIFDEDLEFDFLYPGDYTISLFYIIADDLNCISEKTLLNVSITDAPIVPITCSSNSCTETTFTYSAPVDCDDYSWTIDESLGTLLSSDSSAVTVQWNSVDHYTETDLILSLGSCIEDVCGESVRQIDLFPSELIVTGTKGICQSSEEWFETDFIPNATYFWEIEIKDSISGVPPNLKMVDYNRALVDFNSFVGNLEIKVTVFIPSRECTIEGTTNTTSLRISSNNNLCTEDLFKAFLQPNIDQEVNWTLANEDIDYLNQQTIPGNDDFFAFDLNVPGNYILQIEVPDLDFTCENAVPLTVLEEPIIDLVGPIFICPGDSVTYTLAGLAGNDMVEWTIFQNNTSTTLTGNEITILWEEGGAPYTIKVERSTEVQAGQICGPESELFDIEIINAEAFEIMGPEVVCYDGVASYEITDFPGEYIWTIDPEYMGTIVEGDSTSEITIQWHYAPDIPFATLSTEKEICGETFPASIDVYFEPYIPEIEAPDTICFGVTSEVSVLDLTSFQEIYYYYNDSLVGQNRDSWNIRFQDTGDVVIRIDVINPNNCPSSSSMSTVVHVEPRLEFGLLTDSTIKQCPKDSFENVVVTSSYIDEEAYYVWLLDGVVVLEGFGSDEVYSFIITKEMILNEASSIQLNIEAPDLCEGMRSIPLDYPCSEFICKCLDEVVGSVDYLTPLECNIASFGGSLDFSTVINPFWQINLIDTTIIIPIEGPKDLTQENFVFDEGSTVAGVAIVASCEGAIFEQICGETLPLDTTSIDTVICDFVVDFASEQLYSPDYILEYECNDDLTYNITFSELDLGRFPPPYNSTVTWEINGESYEGITIVVEGVEGGSELDIQITQCSLDGTYCCTTNYEETARDKFSPNIILPNGSCENDIWDFALDVNSNDILSALWDFGDGSGSTLVETSKGFMDTLSHDISVVVVDNLGCVATDSITVKSFPNNIDGEIEFESDPCASFVSLSYIENSESIIASYEWDIFNAPDTSVVEITNSGNYSVTVTDVNGCTNSATADEITVNESFLGGLRFSPENCGTATASILASSQYSYAWFINGAQFATSSSVQINETGTFEIKVVSTSLLDGQACDSIVETITIFPLPEAPDILQEKLICDPFIIDLSLGNYDLVTWEFDGIPLGESAFVSASQNGTYTATVEDENSCTNRKSVQINEFTPPFDQLIDQCIQACREDLDSLEIMIPGLDYFASSWTWISVDSLGQEYEIQNSTGFITPLLLTSEMYEYIQLQVTEAECIFRSERIPLDIQSCDQPDPPIEIICEEIDSDHASCGQSIYECLLSEANGGPKLYFEGSVTLPMNAVLCTPDSLDVSLNNGEIIITDILFEEEDGKLTAFYSANILIEDAADYAENGTIIRFDFCDENGDLAQCYEYNLPYRSCGNDFDCLIDYEGVSSGGPQTVNVDYCLNLSEVVQDDCILSSYLITAHISGDIAFKTVYSEQFTGDFNNLTCLSIPIDSEDFFSGEYNCIELMVEGDCPGIECSEYQCGMFGSSNFVQLEENSPVEINKNESKTIGNLSNKKLDIYPNPSTGIFNVEIDSETISNIENRISELMIFNSLGQMVNVQFLKDGIHYKLDMSDQHTGMYYVVLKQGNTIIERKRLLLMR